MINYRNKLKMVWILPDEEEARIDNAIKNWSESIAKILVHDATTEELEKHAHYTHVGFVDKHE